LRLNPLLKLTVTGIEVDDVVDGNAETFKVDREKPELNTSPYEDTNPVPAEYRT
jgi:hypothetical protein